MSKHYKNILIFMVAIMMVCMYSLPARGEVYFDLQTKPGWEPGYTLKDTMIIGGILTIDQERRAGDEIGVYFQGKLCGTTKVRYKDGTYSTYIFNYNGVENGPHPGDVLEIRLWDSKKQEELSAGIKLDILDPEVKDAEGHLIWKLRQDFEQERGFPQRTVNITYSPPLIITVTKVEPNQSYSDQSQEIKITGSNFSDIAKVKIGSTELTAVNFVNATTLTATVPAGLAAGTYGVTVSVGESSETLENAFTVLASIKPQVSMLSPDHGKNDQVTRVLIVGSNFLSGSRVKIGDVFLTNLTYVAGTALYADIPAGLAPGAYPLTVIAPEGGREGVLPNGFTVQPGHEEKVSLMQGLNLIAYPVKVSSPYSSYDFISSYFTPQSLDSLWHYNLDDGQWEITSWDDQGLPAGASFDIENGEGCLLYAKVDEDIFIPGLSDSSGTNLYSGMNLVSFSSPDAYYTSYDLLQDMLNEGTDIVALQKYEKDSGRWPITFCLSGEAAGDNFTIKKDESYIVYMKEDRVAWLP